MRDESKTISFLEATMAYERKKRLYNWVLVGSVAAGVAAEEINDLVVKDKMLCNTDELQNRANQITAELRQKEANLKSYEARDAERAEITNEHQNLSSIVDALKSKNVPNKVKIGLLKQTYVSYPYTNPTRDPYYDPNHMESYYNLVVVQNGLFRTPAVIKEKLIGYLVSREVAKDPVASMLKQKINNIIAAAYERGENYYQGPITCFPEFNSLRDKYNHICLNLRKVVEPEVKKQMASELRKHAPRKDTATAIDKAIELLHERMDILKNELRGIEQLQSMKKRPRVMTHAEYVAKKQDYSICELEKTSANRGLQKLSMGLDVVAIVAAGLFIKYMYSRLRLNRPKNTK